MEKGVSSMDACKSRDPSDTDDCPKSRSQGLFHGKGTSSCIRLGEGQGRSAGFLITCLAGYGQENRGESGSHRAPVCCFFDNAILARLVIALAVVWPHLDAKSLLP